MKNLLALFILITCISCSKQKPETQTVNLDKDPLPSWNEGNHKNGIKSFVRAVTNQEKAVFVEKDKRIAVLDVDGTLWSEQPISSQYYFTLERVKTTVDQHPEWKESQPFKAVLQNDLRRISAYGANAFRQLLRESYEGDADDIKSDVEEWLDTPHPLTKKNYAQTVYQPMIEVVEHLKANDFTVYLLTYKGVEFLQPVAEKLFDIPADQVIGLSIQDENNDFDIEKAMPVRPILTIGNSDSDLEMMLYSDEQEIVNFQMFINHTDSLREWAYDSATLTGQLKKGLMVGIDNGWLVADMMKDWNTVYGQEMDSSALVQ